jgi:hypothetical protein
MSLRGGEFDVSDNKMLFWIVLGMGALVAIWWFGWFDSATKAFLAIKTHTTYR